MIATGQDSTHINLLFMAGGGGGTLRFVHQALNLIDLPIEICGVIADKHCGATAYAQQNNIPNFTFSPFNSSTAAIIDTLKNLSPTIVVTTINRIIVSEILQQSQASFINLHYSLLPAFAGMIGFEPLQQAKERNTKIIDATCHHVNHIVDGGQIISQSAMAVDWNDNFLHIGDRVFRMACNTLLNAIMILAGIEGTGRQQSSVLYSPQLKFDESRFTQPFWDNIKHHEPNV